MIAIIGQALCEAWGDDKSFSFFYVALEVTVEAFFVTIH